MKSNNRTAALLIITVLLLTAGCTSNYYDKLGGYPLQSNEFGLEIGSAPVKLDVTYRFPFQKDVPDSTALNLTVKVIVAKDLLPGLKIEKLTLAATDGSYLFSYDYPAVYDINGKYPISSLVRQDKEDYVFNNRDQASIFHVLRESTQYNLTLSCATRQPDATWQEEIRTVPLDISGVTHKVGLQNPVFLQE